VGTTSAPQTLTLSDYYLPLTISDITITGANASDFAQSNTCGATLPANTNCQIQVIFKPSVGGPESATLTVTDDSRGVAGATQTVTLGGTGQDFAVGASGGAMTVLAGETATVTLQVTSEGGWNGTVSFTCSGAPLNSTCWVTPAQMAMAEASSSNATLTIATTSRGVGVPQAPEEPRVPPVVTLLTLLAFLASIALAPIRHLQPRVSRFALLTLLALVVSWTLASCSSPQNSQTSQTGTPAGTYLLTATATSGGLSHEVTVNLTVQ
jgi:hypothetical protein